MFWHTTQAQRLEAAQKVAKRRGHEVRNLEPLLTGLWYHYQDMTGQSHMVNQYEFAKALLTSNQGA
jgi:creatinine amidohydrolase/Fe(II)-dependent formamide hydrolase-like protein